MTNDTLLTVGWREIIALPELGIPHMKVKVDTGARTSCLHAFCYETVYHAGAPWIRFGVHPMQNNTDIEQYCEAIQTDERMVTDSGGHQESRPIIETTIQIGDLCFRAECTLTNRDTMRFRMLLGRTAMANRILVNPAASYLAPLSFQKD